VLRAIKFKISASTIAGSYSGDATSVPEDGNAYYFVNLGPGEEGYVNSSNYARPSGRVCPDGSFGDYCPYDGSILGFIYIGGNPGKPESQSYAYSVQAELLGWFYGDDGIPAERYNKYLFFTTN
jgi:hypothetical protein